MTNKFIDLFPNKSILGMIHLSGDPHEKVNRAIEEIHILADSNIEGAIIENYHGDLVDVIKVLEEISITPEEERPNIIIGINILPNEYSLAFQLCQEFDFIKFIQLDYISGTYNSGKTFLDVEDFLSKKESLPVDVAILGGVWPKYYSPIPDSDLRADIEEAKNLCDAIVVTGSATGSETPLSKIATFKAFCNDFPLVIGAGINSENISKQFLYGDAGIIGSSLKPNSRTTNKISRELVENLTSKISF